MPEALAWATEMSFQPCRCDLLSERVRRGDRLALQIIALSVEPLVQRAVARGCRKTRLASPCQVVKLGICVEYSTVCWPSAWSQASGRSADLQWSVISLTSCSARSPVLSALCVRHYAILFSAMCPSMSNAPNSLKKWYVAHGFHVIADHPRSLTDTPVAGSKARSLRAGEPT